MSTKTLKTLEENWKRALADYQNLLKRVESDKKDFVKFANTNLLAKLIPVKDILDLAATHSQDPGVIMAVKQFSDALASEGVHEINPKVGDTYDVTLHECIETVSGEPDNTIAETLTKGYKIDELVIRPARVKVNKLALDK